MRGRFRPVVNRPMGHSSSRAVPRTGTLPRPSDPDLVSVLHGEILRFRNYGGFQVCPIPESVRRKVADRYSKALRLSRSLYLMELFANDGPQLFPIPSVPDLFSKMFERPRRLMDAYGFDFAQNFGFTVKFLYNKMDVLGQVVVDYFNADPTFLPLFAFSTFPSLFGGFVAAEFCERAVVFLRSVFQIAGPSKISDVFCASFFASAHGFYNCLWRSLAATWEQKASPLMDFPEMFQLLEDSILSASPFLPSFHVEAFAAYCASSPNHCGTFIVETLLTKPFLRVTESSAYFTTTFDVRLFAGFLELLRKMVVTPFGARLSSLFAAHRGNADMNPSLRLSLWRKLIPLVMNDNDVRLLSAILSSPRSEIPFRFDISRVQFTADFKPVVFEQHLEFVQATDSGNKLGRELFGVEPPHGPPVNKFSNHDALLRRWHSLEDLARTRGEPVVDLIWQNVSRLDRGFLLFAECQMLEIYKRNFSAVEEKILIAEYLSKLKGFLRMIGERNTGMLHCYSATFFKSILDSKATLEQSIIPIYGLINEETSRRIIFEVSCLALDCADFPVTKDMVGAEAKFGTILTSWIEKAVSNRVKFTFEGRRKQVLDCAVMLQVVRRLKLGRILKTFIEFQDRLQVIIGNGLEPDWAKLFFFAVAHSDCPQVLRNFLIFHHFVFQSAAVVEPWDRNIHDRWQRFAAGMWHILREDRKLCEQCSDPKAVSKLFVKKSRFPIRMGRTKSS
jgi:hypothetical protein